MAEMVKLFVNGEEVEVESGKNLIDAIGAVGIEIPHLCYHPALGADGNCRMCLVGIEDGRPPVVPACKTPAREGMRVQLDTDNIKKIQRDIMEFELINHPVDCPICDQAGECKLQDYYMAHDLQDSRMRVPQVTKGKKMDFGCGVVHDQERCVVCGRCVRFTRQITKTGELGIINRTDAARVNIFPGRPLNNRYALNIVDLCPVGAMTSRDFRFKQRVWFLKKDKGICHGCARGCNIFIDHNREKYKDDVIYRYRPRLNSLVNGYFMCDEGRLSYKEENENRLTATMIEGKETSFEDGIQRIQQELNQAKKPLMLISPNSTLEQQWAVKRIATLYGARCSGYSEGYVKAGDGDDFLICDDKSANRRGLQLLDIDCERTTLEQALGECDLFISFDNDPFRFGNNEELRNAIAAKRVIAISSHENTMTEISKVALPVASYSEYDGTIVNINNVLQSFTRAVRKNEERIDILEVTRLLGGAVRDNAHAWPGMKTTVEELAEVHPDRIPAEGLQLSVSEESHVSA
ncbi:2Fe-2S iron-sulfur cluster-binding protein [Desulfopila aestuarii]|uniref:NADH dehydrogenase subunit G n=1 Tax=Desulfopila aestuarii DSM 18488 TaxID=1121416 RepID=A0A1M7XZX7_9BACT|nr:2Fe-2S iron-sulfur cluster-binding protein [Desulfopila aestuarii]SHO44759.1 NADH dehydrogenase subunit G [Desulfopila aestuarii DSM 18488]